MRSDITDVVSSYVSLKKNGYHSVCLCPFHSEKTPSFHIYPENGSFFCFGCGVGGDVITFIKRIENIDYLEAIRLLAQRSGIAMPEDNKDDSKMKLRSRIFEANREAAHFYYKSLYTNEGKNAYAYLRSRGLTDKVIKHFGLGYSPGSTFSLVSYLKSCGFKDDELVDANLAFISKKGNLIDRFIDRVMFPILDLRGNVIAFGGRIMGDGKPKYLNTSDTMVFKKSNNLFALNFAKNKKSDQIILAEGYMDVIALHQAGFTETVATLGTALTREQARIIKNYTNEVVIAYDSDEAGQKASARAINILREIGLAIKIITIPTGKDPDEYIRSFGSQGQARFKQLINNSGNDIDYQLEKIKSKINIQSTEGKIAYLKQVVKVLSGVDEEIEREVYAGKISLEVDVDKLNLLKQIQRERKKSRRIEHNKHIRQVQQNINAIRDFVNPEKGKNLRAANAEEALISYIMNNQDMANDIFLKIPSEKFLTLFNRRVYEHIKNRITNFGSVSITDFINEFSDDEVSRVVKILVSDISKSGTIEALDDYINVILVEHEKTKLSADSTTSLEDIKSYMEKLKEQKK